MAAEVYHLPFPIAHYGVSVEDSLRALNFLFAADVAPARVAAIAIEPVQGEGGFHMAPPESMQALRRICDEHGILLIADEVQSGFARTGKMYGVEHSGIEPDLVAIAKSLGGGFPIAAVTGKAAIMDQVDPGGLGGTYGGSPIGCAAALAVLDVIEEEKLLERANTIGEGLKTRLNSFAASNSLRPIGHIRGPGAMVAFDMLKERGSDAPDGAAAKALTIRARELGLILLSCGIHGETIRLLMPLTASDAIIDEGMDMIEKALAR